MKNLNIKQKLLLIVVFPFLGLLFLSISSVITKTKDLNQLEKFEKYLHFSAKASNLIHHLQIERGLSAGYLGSNGIQFKTKILQQRKKVDQSYIELIKVTSNNHNFIHKDELVSHQEIKKFRKKVDNLSVSTEIEIDFYTKIIYHLIENISKISLLSNDFQLSSQILRFSHLINAKEYAGLERGIANGIFTSQEFNAKTSIKLSTFKNNYTTHINSFKNLANKDILTYFNKQINNNEIDKFEQMQEFIYNKIYKNELLSKMKALAGYGGLIHDFKNYVLRGKEKYKIRFSKYYTELNSLIKQYKRLKTTDEELELLNTVQVTFKKYQNGLSNIDKFYNQNMRRISSLDKIVKVDDNPAINALNKLSSGTIGVDAKEWFYLATKRLDILKKVEDRVSNNLFLIQNDLQSQYRYYLTYQILIIIILLAIVLTLSIFISQDILSKLSQLQHGLVSFFGYISKKEDKFTAIEIEGKDEFHDMAEVLNDNIKETANYIKKEITRQRSQEKQMAQQSRSAAMGDMMSAIIHQWKQPINGISIANSTIEMQIMLDDFDKDLLTTQTNDIKKYIENMNTTMNDFRDFFKPQDKTIYEVSKSINSVYKLVGTIFAVGKVNIKMDLEDGIKTEGYPNELNQVIINILNNARDIIHETNCEINDVFIKSFKENNKAVITITDCAGGVPENIIDRIFEPYVTTKSNDKGTGIGLDMSKTIIEKAGGKLSVKNITKTIEQKDYKGASFKIELNLV